MVRDLCKLFGGAIVLATLASCGTTPPNPSPTAPQAGKIRPASGEVLTADSAVIEQVYVDLQRKQQSVREEWSTRTFEEFKQSVYREPGGGKYIVNGDTPILNDKQLEEFFETKIKQAPPVARLVVHTVNGEDARWNTSQKKQLSYCVSSTFGNRYDQTVADMAAATQAWEAVADVDFIHVAAQDGNCTADNANVVFDVRPVNVNGQYLARAFFPNEPRSARNVLIDDSAFTLDPSGKLTLTGILRHELGHTLGFRHEHTRPEAGACFEDSNWRPLTSYDAFSVMHYPQCNGAGDWSLILTHLDQNGSACLYGAAPGFQVDPAVCPDPAQPPSTPCSERTQSFSGQVVQDAVNNINGAFAVTPGTVFRVTMTGSGDPDLYVRFSQPPSRTAGGYDCRPYLNGADERCELDVPANVRQAFVMVHGYRAATYNLVVTHTPGQGQVSLLQPQVVCAAAAR